MIFLGIYYQYVVSWSWCWFAQSHVTGNLNVVINNGDVDLKKTAAKVGLYGIRDGWCLVFIAAGQLLFTRRVHNS